MKKLILTSIVITIFLLTVTEKTHYAQNSNTEKLPAQNTSNQTSSDAERISNLETRLNSAENYNGKILDTVYWALGGLVTVLVLVVGLGWYTNFRIYQLDKTKLVDELRETLRTESLKEARETAKIAVKELSRDFKKTQYDLLKIEANKWESDDIHDNVLRTYVQMIEIAKELEYDFLINKTLESMQRVLKARLKVKNEAIQLERDYLIDIGVSKKIEETLDNLPKGYTGITGNLKQLLQQNS